MASHHPIRKQVVAPAPVIPDKLYFRIGDVARLCEVPAYVLRFWETEFPQLKPNKGGTGQRLYRRKDVEIALRIKSLLYDQGYTIPGARQVFKSEAAPAAGPQPEPTPLAPQPMAVVPQPIATPPVAPHQLQGLHALREELHKLAAQLAQPIGNAPSAPALTVVPTPAKPKPLRPRLVAGQSEPASKPALKGTGFSPYVDTGTDPKGALKGTGFSPYMDGPAKQRALAPERTDAKPRAHLTQPLPTIDPRQRDLFASD